MTIVDRTEKRRAFIINLVYFLIIIGILYLALTKALPLLMPFVIAFLIAAALQRPAAFIASKTKLKKSMAGIILLVALILVVLGLLALAGVQIVSYLASFMKTLANSIESLPAMLESLQEKLLSMAGSLPESAQESVQGFINSFFQDLMNGDALKNVNMSSMLTGTVGGVWAAAKSVPNILFATIIGIVCCFFMTSGYDNIMQFVKRQLASRYKNLLSDTKGAFFSTVGKLIRAYCIIIFVTFSELLIGFFLLRLIGVYEGKYIIILALIIAIVDILPVLGTGTILIPWIIYEFIMGQFGLAVGLLVMYIVICIVRQYIEPKIVGTSIGLNPLVTLMAMYIGLKMLGFIGMFLFPVTIILIKVLQDTGKIHIWKSRKDREAETAMEVAVAADIPIEFVDDMPAESDKTDHPAGE